jgi:uncharacterized protein YjbI with pentapeptide repeats
MNASQQTNPSDKSTSFPQILYDRVKNLIKPYKPWFGLIVVLIIIVLIVIAFRDLYLVHFRGYVWNEWTGFGEYTGPVASDQRAKTLWDWMQLLIVPLILAVGAVWFNWNQKKVEQELADKRAEIDREVADKRAEIDREIAIDRQRQTALDAYYDKMAEFLLDKGLRASDENAEIRAVARARTLATLRILDGKRKGALIRFLQESKLINKSETFINIQGADLRQANLIEADLREAYLIEVDLIDANLFMADLSGADLTDAKLIGTEMSHAIINKAELNFADLSTDDLSGAGLSGAKLGGANLREAKLISAHLDKAILSSASLSGADLRRAYLIGANLRWADLNEADLTMADLNGADLREADMIGAILKGANLEKANLVEANVTYEQLSQANSLEGATMPDGTIHE